MTKKKSIKDFKPEELPLSPFEGARGRARYNAAYFMGKKTADVGCGLMKLGHHIPEIEFDVTTIDIRPEVKPDILGNILDGLPIEDETFDIIHTSHFMEHFTEDGWNHYPGWDEMDKCMEEMCRILKPKGEIVHVIPSPHSGMAMHHEHRAVYSVKMWDAVFSRKCDVLGRRGAGTWIEVDGLYDFFNKLADTHAFFGNEYVYWLRKK